MKRIVANSENLQKTFPKVYEDLFSKSSVVVSAPGCLWWTGEHGVLDGNFAILQKLPMRVYLGLEPTTSHEVKIGSYLYFSPGDRKILPALLEEPLATKLITFLKEQPEIQKGGLILHILTELPPSRGLNSSGALAVALSTALNIFWDKLSQKEVLDWGLLPTEKLLKDPNFHKTLYQAWKFESIFHGDVTSGCTVLGPMVAGDYPVICFPPPHDLTHKQEYWEKRYSHLDSKKISGVRLNEFFGFKSLPSWSFDFGLIYSGDARSTSIVMQTAFGRRKELDEVLKNAKKFSFPEPYKLPETHTWKSYMNALKVNSLEVLLSLREVFEKGLSQKAMRDFFQALNRNQGLLNMVTVHSAAIESIENHLRQIVYEFGDEFGIGTKISGGGLKGDVMFVTAYHGIRESIPDILQRIGENMKLDFFLDYASWLDGIEDEAVVVEQNLATKNYSKFISPGSVFVRHFSSKGFNHTDIYTPANFEREKGARSLILDPVNNEVWIKKLKLNSKDIPTSITTIKVLKILLDNLGKSVKNTRLPESSYTADRNEFQSKIVSPLNKVLRKELNKELPIEIHGGFDDFTVKLSAELPFSVHYIEKVF